MKAKKEILILIGLIVVLGVYLLQRKTDRTHYTLPTLEAVAAGKIDKIEITRGQETLTLNKKDDQWVIAPGDKLADKSKVSGMSEALAQLKVTALVSEAASYARYELDQGNRIVLKGWQGDQLVRELELGKAASTFQHTFVKLPGNPNVYHAGGHLRPKFEYDAEGLRDLTVFSVQTDQIQALAVTLGDKKAGFKRSAAPEPQADTKTESESEAESSSGNAQSGEAPEANSPPAADPLWVNLATEQPVAADKIGDLLQELAKLECNRYLGHETPAEVEDRSPHIKIEVTGEQDHTLTLFKPDTEDVEGFMGKSSQTSDAFILAKWKVEDLEEKLKGLISPEAAADESEPAQGQGDSS